MHLHVYVCSCVRTLSARAHVSQQRIINIHIYFRTHLSSYYVPKWKALTWSSYHVIKLSKLGPINPLTETAHFLSFELLKKWPVAIFFLFYLFTSFIHFWWNHFIKNYVLILYDIRCKEDGEKWKLQVVFYSCLFPLWNVVRNAHRRTYAHTHT